MFFTEGKDREYERMMREVPKHHREPLKKQIASEGNQDCPYCLYYTTKGKRCKYNKCIVFSE